MKPRDALTGRPKPTAVGVALTIAGIVLYAGTGVASAIEYNMLETSEGVTTGPASIWIQLLAWGSVAIGITGVILTFAFVAMNAAQRRRN